MFKKEISLSASRKVRIETNTYKGKELVKICPMYVSTEGGEGFFKGQVTFKERQQLVDFIARCKELLSYADSNKLWEQKPTSDNEKLLKVLLQAGIDAETAASIIKAQQPAKKPVEKPKPKQAEKPVELEIENILSALTPIELRKLGAKLMHVK